MQVWGGRGVSSCPGPGASWELAAGAPLRAPHTAGAMRGSVAVPWARGEEESQLRVLSLSVWSLVPSQVAVGVTWGTVHGRAQGSRPRASACTRRKFMAVASSSAKGRRIQRRKAKKGRRGWEGRRCPQSHHGGHPCPAGRAAWRAGGPGGARARELGRRAHVRPSFSPSPTPVPLRLPARLLWLCLELVKEK